MTPQNVSTLTPLLFFGYFYYLFLNEGGFLYKVEILTCPAVWYLVWGGCFIYFGSFWIYGLWAFWFWANRFGGFFIFRIIFTC
uniref:hypothetical protein n=1 Tax=Euplotes cristatus TaxID=756077 RepID=UPI002E797946|nr:hypothetical protein V3A03_mgp06 [Euplotes cristatus]UPM52055.1 hypothetical protein [Euplotes cristatus]